MQPRVSYKCHRRDATWVLCRFGSDLEGMMVNLNVIFCYVITCIRKLWSSSQKRSLWTHSFINVSLSHIFFSHHFNSCVIAIFCPYSYQVIFASWKNVQQRIKMRLTHTKAKRYITTGAVITTKRCRRSHSFDALIFSLLCKLAQAFSTWQRVTQQFKKIYCK